ncbi:methylenetetrahydrofolate reductase [Nocardia aurea]|uniref:methylenetetrahydrofolate reductase n=1 Tax=Nocardia aurea TaxID=2144174 RepID=UPI0018E55A8F|nr:methylenetetrahydrofolate reductase [Nocardia aurea]
MLYFNNDTAGVRRKSNLAELVRNMSYEVMPFKKTEQDVVEHVPTEVPLTVTVTEAKGIDTTLALTERLAGHGYRVSPHLPARQFVDERHVADVIARLSDSGITSVFVIGGDAPKPAGKFGEALGLLRAMDEIGHPFDSVGIGGYPEGHAAISQSALDLALAHKSSHATRVLTQICFDADAIGAWGADIRVKGVDLPVYVGMPGPVSRQKLIRISAGIGLGQSARFLQKQQSLIWKFFMPGAYNPTKLVRRLGVAAPKTTNNIAGLHIFTFNELRGTEEWRQQMLASLGKDDRS